MSFPSNQSQVAGAIPTWAAKPDFITAAAAGLIPGASVAFAVGHISGLNMATGTVDICEQGTLYPFLTTAQTLKVSSTSASDAAAGTGAQVLLIQGLDANYAPIQETIITNGVTAVNTVNQYLRVNLFGVVQAGSAGSNVGTITLQLVAGGSIQGIIRPNIGDSQQAVFTVPAGYEGVLIAAQFSMAGSPAVNFGQAALTSNAFGPTARNTGVRSDINSGFPYNEVVLIGFPNPAKTDITARMISVGQDATEVSAGFTLLLLSTSVFPPNPPIVV
jgi:hypothetical protein